MDNFDETKVLIIDKHELELGLLKNDIAELKQIKREDYKMGDYLNKKIKNRVNILREYRLQLENMRENKDIDIKERDNLINVFPGMVKRLIPDNERMVFYPVKNIGSVFELIESGIISKSYDKVISDNSKITTKIKVITKDNIKDACIYANYPLTDYMPYGAIFVLKPSKDDLEEGIIGQINFKTSPERLYGIITTKENINKLKVACEKSGIDESKVYTKEQFLLKCDEWFRKKEEEKRTRWGRL